MTDSTAPASGADTAPPTAPPSVQSEDQSGDQDEDRMSCGPACIPGSLSLGAVTGPLPLSALAAVSRSAPHSPAPGRAAPHSPAPGRTAPTHGTPVVLSCSQDGRVEVVQSGGQAGPASLASSRATLANQVKQPTRSVV